MRLLVVAGLCLLSACLRQAEERAADDLEIGRAAAGDVDWQVAGGLANVVAIDSDRIELWAAAPDLRITAVAGSAAQVGWEVAIDNVPVDAVLEAEQGGAALAVETLARPRPTAGRWRVSLVPGATAELRVAPPDADDRGRFRIAVMGDIQTALDRVDQVFAVIDAQPDIRFVASTGDLVENGERGEYELLRQQLSTLDVPYYTTLGNHELFGDSDLWREYFGRFNVHFSFKGAHFSLVDSGSATVDPIVYGWLDDWMAAAGDDPHLFFTHFPPLDPVGVRAGSFRSRKEASKLLGRLAAGGVDITLYGHIHSFYEFENAGIPARISGGGGALPEKFDGIERHFLVLEIDGNRRLEPGGGIVSIEVVRVD